MSFKVGDRVRVRLTHDFPGWFKAGETAVVTKVDSSNVYGSGDFLYVKWDVKDPKRDHATGGWFARRFELIPSRDDLYIVVCGADIVAKFKSQVDAEEDAQRASKDDNETYAVYRLIAEAQTHVTHKTEVFDDVR